MLKIECVIAALESAKEPCRHLDALATGWALGPPGWVLDPIEDLDGWGILNAPDIDGDSTTWMCAADVGYVSRYMDAAMELITAARPDEAALISTRAFIRLLKQPPSSSDFGQSTACTMVAELLRSIYVNENGSGSLEKAA